MHVNDAYADALESMIVSMLSSGEWRAYSVVVCFAELDVGEQRSIMHTIIKHLHRFAFESAGPQTFEYADDLKDIRSTVWIYAVGIDLSGIADSNDPAFSKNGGTVARILAFAPTAHPWGTGSLEIPSIVTRFDISEIYADAGAQQKMPLIWLRSPFCEISDVKILG